jgi:hypothetical protein
MSERIIYRNELAVAVTDSAGDLQETVFFFLLSANLCLCVFNDR